LNDIVTLQQAQGLLFMGMKDFPITHYICKGECQGVSDMEGICQNEFCSRYHQPLEQCTCTDGRHGLPEEKDDGDFLMR